MSFWGFREREMGFIGRFQRSRRGVWEFLEFEFEFEGVWAGF